MMTPWRMGVHGAVVVLAASLRRNPVPHLDAANPPLPELGLQDGCCPGKAPRRPRGRTLPCTDASLALGDIRHVMKRDSNRRLGADSHLQIFFSGCALPWPGRPTC